jgi:hypothetical protein
MPTSQKDTRQWTLYVLMISFAIYLVGILAGGILTYFTAEKKALLLDPPATYINGMTRETLETDIISQLKTQKDVQAGSYIVQTLVSVIGLILCVMTLAKYNQQGQMNGYGGYQEQNLNPEPNQSPLFPFILFFFFVALGCLSAFGAAAFYKNSKAGEEDEKFVKGYVEMMIPPKPKPGCEPKPECV